MGEGNEGEGTKETCVYNNKRKIIQKYKGILVILKHIKQNLTKLKRHIDGFIIIHGGCDSSSSEMHQAIRTLKSSIDLQHINRSTNYSDQRDIRKNNFNVRNVYFFK